MAYFFIGLLLLLLLLLGARAFVKADTYKLAKTLRKLTGFICILVGGGLLITGRGFIGAPILGYGFYLLNKSFGWASIPNPFGTLGGSYSGNSGGSNQKSIVKTDYIEMELDHETGDMKGRFIKGSAKDNFFSQLNLQELIDIRQNLDQESIALLDAYLDSRFPTWREDTQTNSTAGENGPISGSSMSKQEALEILGLKSGASAEEIRKAHRALLKRVHPDVGGSTFLTARVNLAKDILLGRHR